MARQNRAPRDQRRGRMAGKLSTPNQASGCIVFIMTLESHLMEGLVLGWATSGTSKADRERTAQCDC